MCGVIVYWREYSFPNCTVSMPCAMSAKWLKQALDATLIKRLTVCEENWPRALEASSQMAWRRIPTSHIDPGTPESVVQTSQHEAAIGLWSQLPDHLRI